MFEDAVRRLKDAGIEVVVHLIIGLPGETKEDCLNTARYLAGLTVPLAAMPIQQSEKAVAAAAVSTEKYLIDGVKLQVLQVLSGTKLAELASEVPLLVPKISLEKYTQIVKEMLGILPETMAVHRLTGDPPKKLLISPLWTADKKKVLNYMRRELSL